jgi:drug/metabolite transporter (DMT)-like permease
MRNETKGLLITLAGALVFTPDALLIRLAATDPFTLAAARAVPAAAMLLAGMFLFYGTATLREFLRLGRWGLIAGALQGVSTVLFCIAISNTSAANALLIFASMPLIAALLGWVTLGERVSTATWLAIVVAMTGIVIVASGSRGGGGIFGDLMALTNALCTAIFYVIARHRSDLNFIPANVLGFIIGALIAAPFTAIGQLQSEQWLWFLIGGCIVLPGAIALFTLGLRYLPAAEVALIGLLEVVLGPLLVWAVLHESVPVNTLIGGAVLLSALVFHMSMNLLRPAARIA